MSHRNARLTPRGRRIIVERVLSGRPVAHVAKEMGVSRACAHRWLGRYRVEGWDGLEDRSSRPKSCPHATPANVVADVVSQRMNHREGPVDLARRCGTSARTVSRILARAGMPKLWDLDPVTGTRIRSSRATDRRYERNAPGDLLHVDVQNASTEPSRKAGPTDNPSPRTRHGPTPCNHG